MQHLVAHQPAKGLSICARSSQAVVIHDVHTNTTWLADVISCEAASTTLFSWQHYLR